MCLFQWKRTEKMRSAIKLKLRMQRLQAMNPLQYHNSTASSAARQMSMCFYWHFYWILCINLCQWRIMQKYNKVIQSNACLSLVSTWFMSLKSKFIPRSTVSIFIDINFYIIRSFLLLIFWMVHCLMHFHLCG